MSESCNAATVTPVSAPVDIVQISKYLNGDTALVAQGGGQKGIFTAGVLDAFLLSNFDPFSHFYGTSAGALNILSYLCRQPKLGHKFIMELTTDPKFFSLYGFMRRQTSMDMKWALEQLTQFPFKLDLNLGLRVLGSRQAYACVTRRDTLKDHYLPMLANDSRYHWKSVMEATCAIPHLHGKEVLIDQQHYVDGGVSASVPVQEAWRRGARCIVAIRTEPVDKHVEMPSNLSRSDQPAGSWYEESLQKLQDYWNEQKTQWQSDWKAFLAERALSVRQQKNAPNGLLNGGRWLFGADDVYRLGQLLGGDFSPRMLDQLMVHYQTYQLTQQFLHCPPQDAYIIQIAPHQPLRSRPLLSDIDDIEFDYQLGLKAGYAFIEQFESAQSMQLGTQNSYQETLYSQSWDTH